MVASTPDVSHTRGGRGDAAHCRNDSRSSRRHRVAVKWRAMSSMLACLALSTNRSRSALSGWVGAWREARPQRRPSAPRHRRPGMASLLSGRRRSRRPDGVDRGWSRSVPGHPGVSSVDVAGASRSEVSHCSHGLVRRLSHYMPSLPRPPRRRVRRGRHPRRTRSATGRSRGGTPARFVVLGDLMLDVVVMPARALESGTDVPGRVENENTCRYVKGRRSMNSTVARKSASASPGNPTITSAPMAASGRSRRIRLNLSA